MVKYSNLVKYQKRMDGLLNSFKVSGNLLFNQTLVCLESENPNRGFNYVIDKAFTQASKAFAAISAKQSAAVIFPYEEKGLLSGSIKDYAGALFGYGSMSSAFYIAVSALQVFEDNTKYFLGSAAFMALVAIESKSKNFAPTILKYSANLAGYAVGFHLEKEYIMPNMWEPTKFDLKSDSLFEIAENALTIHAVFSFMIAEKEMFMGAAKALPYGESSIAQGMVSGILDPLTLNLAMKYTSVANHNWYQTAAFALTGLALKVAINCAALSGWHAKGACATIVTLKEAFEKSGFVFGLAASKYAFEPFLKEVSEMQSEIPQFNQHIPDFAPIGEVCAVERNQEL